MRTPFFSLIAAALLFSAAPALAPAYAHDGDDGADGDSGAINCPVAHAAPAHHHVHAVHHARRSGGCPTQVAHEEHHHLAWGGQGHGWAPPPRGGDEEYGRQNFSWAPTGPGDEHPGPSTWRPGDEGSGLQGAPPSVYAGRDFDHRDQGERSFSEQFSHGERGYGDHHDFDHRDQGERDFGDRFARGGEGHGEGDFDHRGFEQRGMGEQRFAFGYSHEEERSWSSQSGGAWMEHRTCPCEAHRSATDQYGFLTWPGKTHYWHGQPVDGRPMGPPPWAGDPQGPVEVHP
jgi:hypothetical protein